MNRICWLVGSACSTAELAVGSPSLSRRQKFSSAAYSALAGRFLRDSRRFWLVLRVQAAGKFRRSRAIFATATGRNERATAPLGEERPGDASCDCGTRTRRVDSEETRKIRRHGRAHNSAPSTAARMSETTTPPSRLKVDLAAFGVLGLVIFWRWRSLRTTRPIHCRIRPSRSTSPKPARTVFPPA